MDPVKVTGRHIEPQLAQPLHFALDLQLFIHHYLLVLKISFHESQLLRNRLTNAIVYCQVLLKLLNMLESAILNIVSIQLLWIQILSATGRRRWSFRFRWANVTIPLLQLSQARSFRLDRGLFHGNVSLSWQYWQRARNHGSWRQLLKCPDWRLSEFWCRIAQVRELIQCQEASILVVALWLCHMVKRVLVSSLEHFRVLQDPFLFLLLQIDVWTANAGFNGQVAPNRRATNLSVGNLRGRFAITSC